MDDILRGLEDDLRAALARGLDEYGEFPLTYDEFAAQLVGILARSAGPTATQEQLRKLLLSRHAADLYLAIACERKAAGAWDVLASRFHSGLKAVAMRSGASESEAEEIAHELPGSLIHPPPRGACATRLGSYDGSGSLFSWLASVAMREHIDRVRAQRPAPPNPPPARLPNPPDAVVGDETGQRLEHALREALLDLSTRETLLLVWKYRDSMPQQLMAQRLEVSEPRVSQLLKRTVDKVRASVLNRIRDDTAPQWASRDQLWAALRNVVGKLLDGQ